MTNRKKHHDMTRSQIFSLAHAIKGNFTCFASALKCAWYCAKIKAGKVGEFAYFKTDGSIRIAQVGQYDSATIKGTGRPKPINQISYFDAERNGWRSFLAENLISRESLEMAKKTAEYEAQQAAFAA